MWIRDEVEKAKEQLRLIEMTINIMNPVLKEHEDNDRATGTSETDRRAKKREAKRGTSATGKKAAASGMAPTKTTMKEGEDSRCSSQNDSGFGSSADSVSSALRGVSAMKLTADQLVSDSFKWLVATQPGAASGGLDELTQIESSQVDESIIVAGPSHFGRVKPKKK